MLQEIFLLIGVPGSGKSWVCERAQEKYEYISHDKHIGKPHIAAIMQAAKDGMKPILTETPFSISQFMEPLLAKGFKVTPVFVIEKEDTLHQRWDERDTKLKDRLGHLTRQTTYKARAIQYNAFTGTSLDVLNHLHLLAAMREE